MVAGIFKDLCDWMKKGSASLAKVRGLDYMKEEFRLYEALERFDLECYARGIPFNEAVEHMLEQIEFHRDSK